eukprot:UN29398
MKKGINIKPGHWGHRKGKKIMKPDKPIEELEYDTQEVIKEGELEYHLIDRGGETIPATDYIGVNWNVSEQKWTVSRQIQGIIYNGGLFKLERLKEAAEQSDRILLQYGHKCKRKPDSKRYNFERNAILSEVGIHNHQGRISNITDLLKGENGEFWKKNFPDVPKRSWICQRKKT